MSPHSLFTPKTVALIALSALLVLGSLCFVYPQVLARTTVQIVPSTTAAQIGSTITIKITISNVQNLYALDVTLNWNTSALKFLNADSRLGIESHSDGILHGDIYYVENNASQETGEYDLVATSQGQVSWFNGSGNIVTITFTVTSLGQSELILTTQLSDGNPNGANFIDHTDINGLVNSTNSSSSPTSSGTSPSSSPSSSGISSSPGSSSTPSSPPRSALPVILVYAIILIVAIAITVAVALMFRRKK